MTTHRSTGPWSAFDEAFAHFRRGWAAADRAFEAAESDGRAVGSERTVRASSWRARWRFFWRFQKASWRMLRSGSVTFKS